MHRLLALPGCTPSQAVMLTWKLLGLLPYTLCRQFSLKNSTYPSCTAAPVNGPSLPTLTV